MLVPWNVNVQHDPHSSELKAAITEAPPMFLVGSDPKVVKPFVNSPFVPSEQATSAREVLPLSYTVSNDTETVVGAGAAQAEAARAARAVAIVMNCILTSGER